VLYLVSSFKKETIPDFWGIPIKAFVVYERVTVTLTDDIHSYESDYGTRYAGVYVDERGRSFWERAGFAGLPSWHMLDTPHDFPLAEWKDWFYPGLRYMRDGQPILAETLNAESEALLGQ
jgi:hypothetical protein